MKRLTYIFVLLIIVCGGCAQGKKMVAPVMTGNAPTTPPVIEEVIEGVTFDNVFDLEVGKKYRIRPSSHVENLGINWLDHKITDLFFSSVREGIPVDTLTVEARFTLKPAPYLLTSDRVRVINFLSGTGSSVYDEIIIEIKQKTEQGEASRGGFTYHIVSYEAVAIENLTNPDHTFEYE